MPPERCEREPRQTHGGRKAKYCPENHGTRLLSGEVALHIHGAAGLLKMGAHRAGQLVIH